MQPEPTLTDLIRRLYGAFNSGDPTLIDPFVSAEDGILGIGTDPREWWRGDAFRQAFHAQIPEMHAAKVSFEPGDAEAFSEGPIGWIADRPTLRMPDGSGVPMRLTSVWRREGDDWRMVQFHVSVGATNEDTLGQELTI